MLAKDTPAYPEMLVSPAVDAMVADLAAVKVASPDSDLSSMAPAAVKVASPSPAVRLIAAAAVSTTADDSD